MFTDQTKQTPKKSKPQIIIGRDTFERSAKIFDGRNKVKKLQTKVFSTNNFRSMMMNNV